MAEGNDVKALEKISTEVDEIQLNILLSTQCIKVQNYLADKLKKQSERQKEVCNFISSANLKLKTEIKLAELEFDSLTSALRTIQSANVEYKKELLLLKERRLEVEERVNNGIIKYENLWMQSKKKYENIPFIKTYLEVKNKCQTIQETISILKNEYEKLTLFKTNKQIEIKELEKQRILQLAGYLIIERPKSIKLIIGQEYTKNKLKNEIGNLLQEYPMRDKLLTTIKTVSKNEVHSMDVKESEGLTLPMIQLQNSDLDILSMNLNKIRKVDNSNSKADNYLIGEQDICNKKPKADDLSRNECYISDYFNIGMKVVTEVGENRNKNYSEKKLIHILEDIKLDRKETSNVVAQIDCNNLQSIDVIKAANNKEHFVEASQIDIANENHSEIIEEVALSNKNPPSVVLPPTQFMDLTQENHFEISSQSGLGEVSCKHSEEIKDGQIDIAVTQDDNQMCENTSSESTHKMKEMILKKHNLDLSPQFVYTKNTYIPKPNKGQSPTKEITSKFFEEKDKNKKDNAIYTDLNNNVIKNEPENSIFDPIASDNNQNIEKEESSAMFKNCSSPKDGQDMSVAGLLFHHGPQSIPDSLNLSVSTAEYEEGDSDFIHGIDSSLLLSPKPDVPTNEENNNQPCSSGMNNFLSGLRKTGLSLFGSKSTDSKGDTNSTNQGNNFTFSFGGDDKRSRGGLFSMFN